MKNRRGVSIGRERFEELVEEAVSELPRKFRKHLKNIAIMVEDRSPRGSGLLGLYHGVPLEHRGPYYGNVAPDVIVIYQRSIEIISATEDEIRTHIRDTVLHEIGHYFGLDEAELRDIENDE